MTGWMTRAQWGAPQQGPCSGSMPATNSGVAIHWIGPGAWRAQGNRDPGALMRQIRSWHTPQGKCDLAYSLAVNDTTVIEGRSTPARPRVRPGSNGNATVNQSHYSVVLLIGDRDGPVPDAMLATAGRAVAWLRAHAGAGPAVVGHRALTATACPGDSITSQLGRIAQLASGGSTTQPPTQQEDQMTPEQATQLAEVHWMLGQIRGTDLPPIQRSTGARLLAPVDETRWLTSNSVLNGLGDIMRRLARIEEHVGMQPTAVPTLALEPPDGALPDA